MAELFPELCWQLRTSRAAVDVRPVGRVGAGGPKKKDDPKHSESTCLNNS